MTINECVEKGNFSHFIIRLIAVFGGRQETIKLEGNDHLCLLKNARKYIDEHKGLDPEIKLCAVFAGGIEKEISEDEWFNPF